MKGTPLRWLLVAPLERIHPWGFEGMSAWNVFRFFVVGVMEGALGIRAAAIAFQVFVSIFPVILVLLSLLPPNSPWAPCPGCLYIWRVVYFY